MVCPISVAMTAYVFVSAMCYSAFNHTAATVIKQKHSTTVCS